MKKMPAIMLVFLVSLSLAGVAMAGPGVKLAPVSCWNMGGFKTILSIKPFSGNIAISGGTIKFYAIHGEVSNGSFTAPVTGTGHMEGDVFHFSLTGTSWVSGRVWTYEFEGFWNAVIQGGEAAYLAGVKDTDESRMNALSGTMALVSGDCKTTVIPEVAGGDIGETGFSQDDGP